MSSLLEHDLQILNSTGLIIGIDEAGRGALAGPVVASAVALEESFYNSLWCRQRGGDINDSKQLTPAKRDALFAEFTQLKEHSEVAYAVGIASVAEIEKLNILGATKLAMQRALETLEKQIGAGILERHTSEAPLFESPTASNTNTANIKTEHFEGSARVLVDGTPLKSFPFRHQAIVRGDGRSLAIAMASIIAKVTRDRIMDGLDIRLPNYGFAEHKGYATRRHRDSIKETGPSHEHRISFLKKLYDGEPPLMEFVFSAEDKLS